MNPASSFGMPQILALMATVAMLFGGGIYLLSKANSEGRLKPDLVAKALGVWVAFLFLAWGTAGYCSGHPFVASGFAPFELMVKAVPALLRAL